MRVSTQYGVQSSCRQGPEKVKADLEDPLENLDALHPRREHPSFCLRVNCQLRVSKRACRRCNPITGLDRP
jgi:hypothetical protein